MGSGGDDGALMRVFQSLILFRLRGGRLGGLRKERGGREKGEIGEKKKKKIGSRGPAHEICQKE